MVLSPGLSCMSHTYVLDTPPHLLADIDAREVYWFWAFVHAHAPFRGFGFLIAHLLPRMEPGFEVLLQMEIFYRRHVLPDEEHAYVVEFHELIMLGKP
jgi:hypothetical protein